MLPHRSGLRILLVQGLYWKGCSHPDLRTVKARRSLSGRRPDDRRGRGRAEVERLRKRIEDTRSGIECLPLLPEQVSTDLCLER